MRKQLVTVLKDDEAREKRANSVNRSISPANTHCLVDGQGAEDMIRIVADDT